MKKYLLLFAAIAMATSASAQFYVSGSAGYATGSSDMLLGTKITATQTENSYGSYGEGANYQFRAGYFFNKTFGIDLGLAYLHGADQTVQTVNIANYRNTNAIARARAMGLSASVVYNFSKHLYGRFGALIKVGGKTEAVVSDQNYYADPENGVTVATAFGVPEGSYLQTNYKEDYHGVLPLGFAGAFGYKHELNENLSLFLEAEYLGISVKRDYSEITEFNTDLVLPNGDIAAAGVKSLDNLPDGYVIKTTYVDTLSNTNTDPSKELSQKVPYSSFGINFGITYTFKKKEAKTN
jgi:hypothetical protein